MSPESHLARIFVAWNQSEVARNFMMLNNIVTSFYHAYFVSSVLKERELYYKFILIVSFHQFVSSKLNEGYPASRVASIFPRKVGKEEATLPTSSSSFDLPIIQLFGWVRQVLYWINQFYLCTHAYFGVLLTLTVPTLHNKTITNSCSFNFMQEFWENYRLNVQFSKNWKMYPDLRWILFWI